MATHRRKVVDVEARKWTGGTLNVVHNVKGEQSAKKGDWLVGNEPGLVEVVKDFDFKRDYEPIDDEWHEPVVIGGETHEGVPVAQLKPVEEPVEEAQLGNADGGLPVSKNSGSAYSWTPAPTPTDEPTEDSQE